jgi:phage baseplate assembly protein W
MPNPPQIEDLLINPRELRSLQDIDETLLEDESQQVFQESRQFQVEATISNSTFSQQQYSAELPLTIPGEEKGLNDFVMIQSLDGLIYQNIKNVLFTRKGEKITDKSFGVGLQDYLFENDINNVVAKIKKEINSQFSKNLSYLTILNLNVVKSSLNENRIDISLKYRAGSIENQTEFSARA